MSGHSDLRGRSGWGTAAPVVVWFSSFVVYVAGAGRPAWSTDEGATVVVVRSSWAAAWRMALDDAAVGPYYLALKPWAAVSTSQLWLRLPSILAAATAVTVLFVLVRRVIGAPTATATAAVMMVLPVMTRYGQYARPYAFAVLGCVFAVLCWWDYLERGRLWSAGGFVAGVVVAGLAHTYSLLIVSVMLVTAAVVPLTERRRDLTRTGVASAVAVGAMLPWLWLVATRARGSPHPFDVSVVNIAGNLLSLPLTSGYAMGALAVGAVFLVVASAGYVLGWLEGGGSRTLAGLGATWLVLPPLALVTLQVLTGKPGLVLRYWVLGVPSIALGVGLALGYLGQRQLVLATLGLIVLAGLTAPAQRGVRSLDGHSGQQFTDLLTVMNLPPLEYAPVLIQPAFYRGVVANDPTRGPARFPLIVTRPDAPLDLIHPDPVGVGSAEFAAMALEAPVVIAFRPSTAKTFRRFRKELAVYDEMVVWCDFHEAILGVFAQEATTFPPAARADLAAQIEAVDPAHIACTAG